MMLNNCRTYQFDYNSLPLLLVSASGIWQKHDFLFVFVFLNHKYQVISESWLGRVKQGVLDDMLLHDMH